MSSPRTLSPPRRSGRTQRFAAGMGAVLMLAVVSGCFRSPGGKTTADAGNPCGTNADCASGTRCASGTCIAGCQTGADCPNAGVCHPDGTCGPRPACTQDTDCSAGFTCNGGTCACSTDYSCWTVDGGLPNTSEICVAGICEASSTCQRNSDCTNGRYCGPVGVCTAPCLSDTDCGGSSQFGAALTCDNGMCVAPCIADSTPTGIGGCNDGQICQGNLCQPAQCSTQADCQDPTLLCTDPNHGRCASFQVCNPQALDACGPLATCAQYPAGQCPPGFDCSQYVCIALPACFIDAQCSQGQLCEMGACHDATPCQNPGDCPSSEDCIAGQCVAHVCRGPADCDGGLVCSGGSCSPPDTGSDILSVRLLTRLSVLEVGSTAQLRAVAVTASGSTQPVGQFQWSVAPSAVAQIDSSGLLTALSAGTATVQVGFARADGTQATPDTDAFSVVAGLDAGAGRVVVVDSASGNPIASAAVVICSARDDAGVCTASQNLTTQSDGTASFHPSSGAFDVSAADPSLNDAGNPVHDIVHLMQITGADLLVPLPGNAAGGAAGFEASVDFSKVHTQGEVEVALGGSTLADLASLDLQSLLGQPWTSTVDLSSVTIPTLPGLPGVPGLPGIPGLPALPDGGSIAIPLTGGVVATVTQVAGVAVTIPVKDTVYALGDPGLRCGWTFAGKLDAQLFFGSITSSAQGGTLAILPFLGAFDHGIRAPVEEPLLPLIANTADLDDSGNPSELIANYTAFPDVAFHPTQPQSLQAQIDVPPNVQGGGQIIILGGAQVPGAGYLPLGITSTQNTGGAEASVTLQMSPLYGGLEASDYAIVAIATAPGGQQVPTLTSDGGLGGPVGSLLDGGAPAPPTQAQGQTSMMIARAPTLPTEVSFPQSFLPFFTNAGYDPSHQQLEPGDTLADLVSLGTPVLRLTVVGSRQRAFVYISPSAIQGTLRVPAAPGNPGYDPASDPSGTSVLAVLQTSSSLSSLASISGSTLLHLSDVTTAVVRAPLP